jgi:DNA-binding transcriptional regulator GbsR (MarR family)
MKNRIGRFVQLRKGIETRKNTIVSKQTGVTRTTISIGINELKNIDTSRIWKEVGSRKKEIQKSQKFLKN